MLFGRCAAAVTRGVRFWRGGVTIRADERPLGAGWGVPPSDFGFSAPRGKGATRRRAEGVGEMRKRFWLLVIGAVALLNVAVFGALALTGDDEKPKKSAILAAAEGEGEGEEEEEEGGLGPAEPDDYFLFQR